MSRRRRPKFRLPFELEWEREPRFRMKKYTDEEGNERWEDTDEETWPMWKIHGMKDGRRASHVGSIACAGPFDYEVRAYGVDLTEWVTVKGTLSEAGDKLAAILAEDVGRKEAAAAEAMLKTLAREQLGFDPELAV